MKYLCLGYLDVNTFEKLPQGEKDRILTDYYKQCEVFRATGRVVMEEGLCSPNSAKSIRSR